MAGGFNEVFQVAPAHPISEIRRQRRHALTVHGTRPSPVSSRSQRENEGRIAATGAPLKCPRGKFFPHASGSSVPDQNPLRMPSESDRRVSQTQ